MEINKKERLYIHPQAEVTNMYHR